MCIIPDAGHSYNMPRLTVVTSAKKWGRIAAAPTNITRDSLHYGPHCGGTGETFNVQISTPCNVTVAVGEPVDVVNVQLPVPALPKPSRFAVIVAVV